MNILFFSHTYPPGTDAGTITIRKIIEKLSKKNKIIVFIPYYKKIEKFSNVTIICSPRMPQFLNYTLAHLYNAFKAIKLIKKGKIKNDVIFAQYTPHQLSAVAGAIVKKFTGLPLLIRSHDIIPVFGTSFFKNLHLKITNELNLTFGKKTDKFFIVSSELKNYLIAKKGYNPNKVEINTNGVDISIFSPQDTKTEKDNSVFFMGSMQPEDGLENLLEAIPIVILKYPKIKFILAGEGSELEKLKKIACKLKILENIKFLGKIDNMKIPTLINSSKVCIGPLGMDSANRSAVPRKIVEYMASAKPIISTPVSKDLSWKDKKTYISIKSDNFRELAAKIILLLKDKNLRKKIGVNARNLIRKKFEWTKILTKLEKELAELAKK